MDKPWTAGCPHLIHRLTPGSINVPVTHKLHSSGGDCWSFCLLVDLHIGASVSTNPVVWRIKHQLCEGKFHRLLWWWNFGFHFWRIIRFIIFLNNDSKIRYNNHDLNNWILIIPAGMSGMVAGHIFSDYEDEHKPFLAAANTWLRKSDRPRWIQLVRNGFHM